jgi:spore coat protein H
MLNRKVLPLLCAALLPAAVCAAPARIDSGGKGGRFGSTYEADRLYTATNGSGAIGGTAVTPQLLSNGQVIESTAYASLFNSLRDGVTEYRFDLPDGSYLLTLQFVELMMNGPKLRRFSVLAEGLPLLTDLDIYARHGRNYAVSYQFAVTVADGQLNVTFPASIGTAAIAGIAVQPASLSPRLPKAPGPVTALGGYGRNILTWPDATQTDLAGFIVSRATNPTGPFSVLTPAPVPDSRWFDATVEPFTAYHYRVAAVDIFGRQGPVSSTVSAAARDDSQDALPVHALTIAPDQYAILQANTESDYVPADFTSADVTYPGIGVRFRGATSLNNHKKSWKLNFKKGQPFDGRDKLNLKAVSMDRSLQSECLSVELLNQVSMLTSQCDFARLRVNGSDMGVFSRLEEVDSSFFITRGMNPDGQLLEGEEPAMANFRILPDYAVAWNDKSANGDGYPALAELIQTINTTPDADFPQVITSVVNVDSTLDFVAAMAATGDWDHVAHNYHVYRSPDSPVWEVIGKDFDQAFVQPTLSLLQGVQTSPRQPPGLYNVLTTRLLNVPLFRQWYVNKLQALLDAPFTPAQLTPRIQALHQAVADDVQRDVDKRFREDNAAFDASPAGLQDFVTQRIAYIASHLAAISPGVAQPLLINEVLPDNRTGIVTVAGLHSPWLELFNPGTRAYSLTGHTLTNNPAQPALWTFPAGTSVPAGGYLLVWLDRQAPAPGEVHAGFTVHPKGLALALYAPTPAGLAMLDSIAYRALPADTSYGRRVNGAALWAYQRQPTPAAANLGP